MLNGSKAGRAAFEGHVLLTYGWVFAEQDRLEGISLRPT